MDRGNFFPETSLKTSCCRMWSLQDAQWGENSCLGSFFNWKISVEKYGHITQTSFKGGWIVIPAF